MTAPDDLNFTAETQFYWIFGSSAMTGDV